MGLDNFNKETPDSGTTEPQPNYEAMCDTLLLQERADPFVSREEIENLIGKHGNLATLLMKLVEKGYLLHGSSSRVLELEPRNASDIGGDPSNELKAVYASKVPEVSLFMSLHPPKGLSSAQLTSSFAVTHNDSGLYNISFGASREPKDFMVPGYMYILERDTFFPTHTGQEYQFASREPVRPRLVIPTLRTDFKYEIETIE